VQHEGDEDLAVLLPAGEGVRQRQQFPLIT
jgi:hypothetical protein